MNGDRSLEDLSFDDDADEDDDSCPDCGAAEGEDCDEDCESLSDDEDETRGRWQDRQSTVVEARGRNR